MISINGTNLPEWLVPELEVLIRDCPDAEIVRFSKSEPSVGRGFRATLSNSPQMKKRLTEQVLAGQVSDVDTPLKESVVEFLRSQSLDQHVLMVLSEAVIVELYPQLLSRYGAGKVLLASVLGLRSSIREFAEPFLQAGKIPNTLPLEEANTILADRLRPFLHFVGELGERQEPVVNTQSTIPEDSRNNKHDAKSAAELKRLTQQIDKRQRQIEKLEKQVSQIEVKFEKESKRGADLRSQLRDSRTEVDQLETKLIESRRQFNHKVSQKVRKTNSRIARYWLQAPTAIKTLSVENRNNVLLETIKQVLQQQEEQDRNFGNRKTLVLESRRLLQGIADIEDAMENALVPLDELGTVRASARERLIQINKLLGDTSDASAIDSELQTLLRKISIELRAAESKEAREKLLETAQYLSSLHILSDQSLAYLHNTQTTRLEVEQELRELALRAASARASKPVSVKKAKKIQYAYGSDRHQIAMTENALVIVDGHNVLLGVPRITLLFGNKDAASAKARQWLIEKSSQLLVEQLDCDAIVMFDSDNDSEESYNERLRVIYASGGMKITGRSKGAAQGTAQGTARGAAEKSNRGQRADDDIIQYIDSMLNYSASDIQQTLFLVTDDKELQRRAEKRGIDRIDASLYANWCLQL